MVIDRTPGQVGQKMSSEDWLKTRTCFQCQKKGHISRDCPEKRFVDPKRLTRTQLRALLDDTEKEDQKDFQEGEQ